MTSEKAIARLKDIANRENAYLDSIGIPGASQIGTFLLEVAEMLKKDEEAWKTVKYRVIDGQMTTKIDELEKRLKNA